MANLPSDDMVRAGSVPAQSQPADDLSLRVIEREAAAEDDCSAYQLSDHRIIGSAESRRISKSSLRIGRPAGDQAIKASSRLRCGVEIRGGDRVIIIAHAVGGVGF